ncbi:putative integral membrane protein [Cryptosporidium felis]|nr:putative integral membrane protein [Cryptosporidium felis]
MRTRKALFLFGMVVLIHVPRPQLAIRLENHEIVEGQLEMSDSHKQAKNELCEIRAMGQACIGKILKLIGNPLQGVSLNVKTEFSISNSVLDLTRNSDANFNLTSNSTSTSGPDADLNSTSSSNSTSGSSSRIGKSSLRDSSRINTEFLDSSPLKPNSTDFGTKMELREPAKIGNGTSNKTVSAVIKPGLQKGPNVEGLGNESLISQEEPDSLIQTTSNFSGNGTKISFETEKSENLTKQSQEDPITIETEPEMKIKMQNALTEPLLDLEEVITTEAQNKSQVESEELNSTLPENSTISSKHHILEKEHLGGQMNGFEFGSRILIGNNTEEKNKTPSSTKPKNYLIIYNITADNGSPRYLLMFGKEEVTLVNALLEDVAPHIDHNTEITKLPLFVEAALDGVAKMNNINFKKTLHSSINKHSNLSRSKNKEASQIKNLSHTKRTNNYVGSTSTFKIPVEFPLEGKHFVIDFDLVQINVSLYVNIRLEVVSESQNEVSRLSTTLIVSSLGAEDASSVYVLNPEEKIETCSTTFTLRRPSDSDFHPDESNNKISPKYEISKHPVQKSFWKSILKSYKEN